MTIEKNILIVDDAPDERAIELLRDQIKEALNDECHIDYTINLTIINPNSYANSQLGANALDPLYEKLNSSVLNKKLDLFLCDFNLDASNKDVAFHIIDHVRKSNKICSVILYSGSPLKELTRINNQELATKLSEHILADNRKAETTLLKNKIDQITQEELPSEELLRMMVQCSITKIVPRKNYEDAVVEVINKPPLLLRLENELSCYEDSAVIDAGGLLNGVQVRVICEHLRAQTQEGIAFASELVELMASHYISLNQLNT